MLGHDSTNGDAINLLPPRDFVLDYPYDVGEVVPAFGLGVTGHPCVCEAVGVLATNEREADALFAFAARHAASSASAAWRAARRASNSRSRSSAASRPRCSALIASATWARRAVCASVITALRAPSITPSFWSHSSATARRAASAASGWSGCI